MTPKPRPVVKPDSAPRRAPETKAATPGRQTRAFALELRATGEDGSVEGYGSVFAHRDAYDDIIAPGAFAASLTAHKMAGTMPAMLWQHDPAEPIGVWSEVAEDPKGLRMKGRLVLDSTRGREAHALLKAGALNGLSIGFMAKQWAYDRDTDVRTLTEIDLWEVSLVTFPANGLARVTSVKAAVDEILKPSDAERWLRDAAPDVSRSQATAFVSRLLRMGAERREADDATARAHLAAERLLRSLQA